MPSPLERNPAVRITSHHNLEEIEAAWNELFEASALPNAFFSWEWISSWWHFFEQEITAKGGKATLHFLLVREEGSDKAVGAFPFYEHRPAGPLSRTEFLPLGDYSADESMNEEIIYLTTPNHEADLPPLVFLHVQKLAAQLGCDLSTYQYRYHVSLSQAPTKTFLGRLRQEEGRQVVQLPSTWKDYYATLSKSMRGNLTYYPRRLERAGHAYAMRILRQPEEMAEGVGHLVRLHRHRAESTRGPRHINHIPKSYHEEFMLECWTRLSRKGMASVALLEIEGEVVAAQAVLILGDELTFYYSGFDTAWYDYSPLTVLISCMVAEYITLGTRRLNLLANPAFFRSRWGAKTETVWYTAHVLNPHPLSLLRIALKQALPLPG